MMMTARLGDFGRWKILAGGCCALARWEQRRGEEIRLAIGISACKKIRAPTRGGIGQTRGRPS